MEHVPTKDFLSCFYGYNSKNYSTLSYRKESNGFIQYVVLSLNVLCNGKPLRVFMRVNLEGYLLRVQFLGEGQALVEETEVDLQYAYSQELLKLFITNSITGILEANGCVMSLLNRKHMPGLQLAEVMTQYYKLIRFSPFCTVEIGRNKEMLTVCVARGEEHHAVSIDYNEATEQYFIVVSENVGGVTKDATLDTRTNIGKNIGKLQDEIKKIVK